jgi:hypothetical protein
MRSALSAALLLAIAACKVQQGVAGSGTTRTEAREVPAFDAIEVSGALRLEVAHGPKQSLAITADDNLLPLLTSEVTGTTLVIEPRKSIRPSTEVRIAAVLARPLRSVTASGSVTGSITAIEGPELSIRISGSGELTLAGKVSRLSVDISGSGDIDSLGLAADDLELHITGSGEARVHAEKTLAVDISGSGTVRYRGSPQVTRSISGSGSVEPL